MIYILTYAVKLFLQNFTSLKIDLVVKRYSLKSFSSRLFYLNFSIKYFFEAFSKLNEIIVVNNHIPVLPIVH